MKYSVVLALCVFPAEVVADTVVLTWTNPIQYMDGTSLNQAIAQTNLRCTSLIVGSVRNLCPLIDQRAVGSVMSYTWAYTVTAYSSGQICFAAQTQLVDASISDWSNEGCKAFSATRKAKPPTLTVK